MRLAEPVVASWKASLSLGFQQRNGKTILSDKRFDGPLVVQKPLYPEGESVCHAIVVHPPGGIAGGDELELAVRSGPDTSVLLTTPGAGKWYRSAGPWASQSLSFQADGVLEWLPRETIVFDGALARLGSDISLSERAVFLGWEVICLGRSGSGERFGRGTLKMNTRITRNERPLWIERGSLEAGGRLMACAAGLGGRSVFGSFFAAAPEVGKDLVAQCRSVADACIALTLLPGLLVARYLGDSSEQATAAFTRLWSVLRPALTGRQAVEPRIWST